MQPDDLGVAVSRNGNDESRGRSRRERSARGGEPDESRGGVPDAGRHRRQRDVLPAAGVALLRRAVRDTRGIVFAHRETPDSRFVDVQQYQRFISQPRQETSGVHAVDGGSQLFHMSVAISASYILHRDSARQAHSRDRFRHLLRSAQFLQDHVLFEQRRQPDTVQSDEQQIQARFPEAVRF